MRACVTMALLLVGASVLCACKPDYAGVDFETQSAPPAQVVVNSREVEIPAGLAVAVSARLRSGSRAEYDSSYELDLYSADRSILRVETQPARGRYVLVGVSPGNTCLDVYIDGSEEECLDVRVTAPR